MIAYGEVWREKKKCGSCIEYIVKPLRREKKDARLPEGNITDNWIHPSCAVLGRSSHIELCGHAALPQGHDRHKIRMVNETELGNRPRFKKSAVHVGKIF